MVCRKFRCSHHLILWRSSMLIMILASKENSIGNMINFNVCINQICIFYNVRGIMFAVFAATIDLNSYSPEVTPGAYWLFSVNMKLYCCFIVIAVFPAHQLKQRPNIQSTSAFKLSQALCIFAYNSQIYMSLLLSLYDDNSWYGSCEDSRPI